MQTKTPYTLEDAQTPETGWMEWKRLTPEERGAAKRDNNEILVIHCDRYLWTLLGTRMWMCAPLPMMEWPKEES